MEDERSVGKWWNGEWNARRGVEVTRIGSLTQMRQEESARVSQGCSQRGWRSDPDEFFRRFPGDFLFFPVVTSGGGSVVCRQFAVKFLQPTPISLLRHGSPRGVEAAVVAAVAALQTRGMAAACSRKPINLYVCPPISSSFAISPYGKIFYVVPTFICDRDFIFISALGLIRDRVIRVWA